MPIDIAQLYRQHPVAVVGVVGGVALAGAYMLSKRGKEAATFPVAPFLPAGSGSGFGQGTGPPSLPCWLSGECPEPHPAPSPHPGPLPRPGPGRDPVEPGCIVCPDGGRSPDWRVPCCGHPEPLPGPEIPEGGGYSSDGYGGGGGGGGRGGADYDYMHALDVAKQTVGMRLSPWG